MKRIIFLIITLGFTYFGQAQDADQQDITIIQELEEQQESDLFANKSATVLMDSALSAYSAGMYGMALEYYRYVIDSLNEESAALYHNMGNASFRRNDLASAILYYEKALKLSPNDDDIIFNLGLANSRIPDRIEPVPEMLFVRWYKSITHLITPNQWAYLTLGILAIALIFLALYFVAYNIIIRKIGFWMGVVLALCFIFSLTVSHQTAREQTARDTGIVFSASLTVKSSPEESSADLFVLHEGAKVWILDSLNTWYKIKIANGSVGWIPATEIEVI
ncbi:MAG: tetratricopeptide repeat protein [Bacteroidales bacterium]|nr:tetratricopeptide repeat protein [Bacteroidales bacterium]